MVSESRLYFAYGSNMDGAQMSERCPGAVLSCVAKLMDYQFLINSRGFATVVSRGGSIVWGVLWTITGADEKELDKYEGVSSGHYKKVTRDLELTIGEGSPALAYLATNCTPGCPRPGYLEKIIKAASLNCFPGEYITELRSWVKPP